MQGHGRTSTKRWLSMKKRSVPTTPLPPEMALRLEKAFGPDMNHLLRMQLAYDVAEARRHSRGIDVKRYAPA
jgi:plasmid maintenance system antidote protein VapI